MYIIFDIYVCTLVFAIIALNMAEGVSIGRVTNDPTKKKKNISNLFLRKVDPVSKLVPFSFTSLLTSILNSRTNHITTRSKSRRGSRDENW